MRRIRAHAAHAVHELEERLAAETAHLEHDLGVARSEADHYRSESRACAQRYLNTFLSAARDREVAAEYTERASREVIPRVFLPFFFFFFFFF